MILQQHQIGRAGKIGARRNAHGLFFFGHFNQTHFRVALGHLQQIDQPCLRQRGNKADTGILDPLIKGF